MMEVLDKPVLTNGDFKVHNGSDNCQEIKYHRRILLTGGSGFIGSHVVDKLVHHQVKRYFVVNYDKLEYCASLKNNSKVESSRNYRFVKGDILNKKKLLDVMRKENIDTVMHFAAQSHVDNSFFNAKPFHKTNVEGTQILLSAAREHGVLFFLHVSTDEVYGGDSIVALSETSELKPTNPYSRSKAKGEKIARHFWEKYSLPVVITRGNNVYGPRQYPEKVIPKFICLLQRDKKCCIHGDGSPVRNFMYVEDAADAYLTVLEKGEPGEIYNIGTPFRITIRDLAVTLIREIHGDVAADEIHRYVEFVDDRPYNDKEYHVDCSKLNYLGWTPVVDWKNGLRATTEWYLHNFSNWPKAAKALVPFPTIKEEADKSTELH